MAKFLIKCLLLGLICCNFNFIVLALFSCDPAIDCAASTAGEKVPDPLDCEQYYLCIEISDGSIIPSSIPLHCGNGFYFNHNDTECAPETVPGSCENICRNECEISCPEPFVRVTLAANKDNCSLYFLCGPAGPVPESCLSEAPYFDGNACVTDPNACCDFCDPYCYSGGIQIVDPCDCASFFVCSGQGEATGENRGTCEIGNYYDEPTATCIPGTCENLCSAVQCAAPF